MEHDISCTYKNIKLRPLSVADIETLRGWRNDREYTKYLSAIPYISEEMQTAWYEKYREDTDSYTWSVICAKGAGGTIRATRTNKIEGIIGADKNCITKDNGVVAGSVSLYNFVDDSCEYGRILIDPSLSGRGIGTAAERLALQIGFCALGMKHIHTYINISNVAAICKSKKNGFIETVDPEHSDSARNYRNHLHMVVYKDNFSEAFPYLF